MSMPPAGTFEYVSIVPPEAERTGEWRVQLARPVSRRGSELSDSRLVGYEPVLAITSCDPAVKPSDKRTPIPRSRFTLKASSRKHATVSTASFYVDQRMLSVFQTDDSLFMSRTACAGRGLSLISQGTACLCPGSYYDCGIRARTPLDLIREAEQPFKRRDAKFEFQTFPLQVEIGAEIRIVYGGGRTMGEYEVSVFHGFYRDIPGGDERTAITLRTSRRHSIASSPHNGLIQLN